MHPLHHLHHPITTSRIERDQPRPITITVLGDFAVTVDGVTTLASGSNRRTASALVKVLALAPGHRLHRERVMDLLWPDEAPADAAPRLHKAAFFARRAIGRNDAVVLRDDSVWLFPDEDFTVDVVEFERLARIAVSENDPIAARAALDWYGGDLLPEDPYEDWAADRRELLHLRRLDVLRVAAEWRELVEAEPTDEEANVELMRAHIDAGDGAAAVRQFEHLQRILERDLGMLPGRDARRAFEEAQQLDDASSSREPAAPVGELLAELARLITLQSAVLAELVAAGAASPAMAC